MKVTVCILHIMSRTFYQIYFPFANPIEKEKERFNALIISRSL